MSDTLIAGIGNVLLKDDGIGPHSIYALQKESLKDCILADIGCAILNSLHLLEEARYIILIDAMRAGGEPGSIYRSKLSTLQDNPTKLSLHQLGLLGAFHLIPENRHPLIEIIGVEPACIEYGTSLSPTLERVLPCVVSTVKEILKEIAGIRSRKRPKR